MNIELENEVVESVLEKLGFSERPEPTAAGLEDLFRAWCLSVPFDNLVKRIFLKDRSSGEVPGDSAASFFASWLEHNTGGTCWAGANALYALSTSLGFEARRAVGNMGARPEQKDPSHGAVVVAIGGEERLLDPSILFHTTVPLRAGSGDGKTHPAASYRVEEAPGGGWLVFWSPLHFNHSIPCLFATDSATADDFDRLNRAALDFSLFNFSTYVRKNTESGIVGTCFGRKVSIGQGGHKTVTTLDAGSTRELLVGDFGYPESIVDQLPRADPLPPRISELLQDFFSSSD